MWQLHHDAAAPLPLPNIRLLYTTQATGHTPLGLTGSLFTVTATTLRGLVEALLTPDPPEPSARARSNARPAPAFWKRPLGCGVGRTRHKGGLSKGHRLLNLNTFEVSHIVSGWDATKKLQIAEVTFVLEAEF